jgi:hypothetical protein
MFSHLADGVSSSMSTNDPTERAKRIADNDAAFHHAIQNDAFTTKKRCEGLQRDGGGNLLFIHSFIHSPTRVCPVFSFSIRVSSNGT